MALPNVPSDPPGRWRTLRPRRRSPRCGRPGSDPRRRSSSQRPSVGARAVRSVPDATPGENLGLAAFPDW